MLGGGLQSKGSVWASRGGEGWSLTRGGTEVKCTKMACPPVRWHSSRLIHVSRIAVLGQYSVQSWGPMEWTSPLLCSEVFAGCPGPGSLSRSGAAGAEGAGHGRGLTPCTQVPSHSFMQSVNLLNPRHALCIMQVLGLCHIPTLSFLILRHANIWMQSNMIGKR